MSDTIIVAPHGDDEIIGCYEVIKKTKCIIIYTEDTDIKRREEITKAQRFTNSKAVLFNRSIPGQFLKKENKMYFPHPIYELHPGHRMQGAIGESLVRQGLNVIFYSTNMNAPFIREEKDPDAKRKVLDEAYPSQSDLWKYDHKYFLFCGWTQWQF